jgi:hypothetical protein
VSTKTEWLDKEDAEILHYREAQLYKIEAPTVGDWVEFADGVTRRISYVWPDGVQTSGYNGGDGGSYYLGEGYVSYSGPLFGTVPTDTLTLRADTPRAASVWFFHHNHRMAHNGINTLAWFKVWKCTEVAPQ